MSNLKVKILLVVIIFVFIGLFYYYSGNYRFTPIAAAKAHFDVGKDASLFGEVDFYWSKVYLFNTSKGPRTVISVKSGFLWRAPAATRYENSSDTLRTVGWMSDSEVQGQAMVFAVESSDPNVAYVEAGPPNERIKKEVKVDTPAIFSWKKVIQFNDLKPVAFSAKGTPLYEYTVKHKIPNAFSIEDIKWYPVNGSEKNPSGDAKQQSSPDAPLGPEADQNVEKGAVWQAAKDYMEAKGYAVGQNIGDMVLVVGEIFDHRAVVIYGPYASEFNAELLLEEEAGKWRVATDQWLYNTNNELAVEAMKALASIEGLYFGHEPGQMKVGVKEQGQDYFTFIIGKYGGPWSAEYDMEKTNGVWSIVDKREIQ